LLLSKIVGGSVGTHENLVKSVLGVEDGGQGFEVVGTWLYCSWRVEFSATVSVVLLVRRSMFWSTTEVSQRRRQAGGTLLIFS
jgi:hypothetical protein